MYGIFFVQKLSRTDGPGASPSGLGRGPEIGEIRKAKCRRNRDAGAGVKFEVAAKYILMSSFHTEIDELLLPEL